MILPYDIEEEEEEEEIEEPFDRKTNVVEVETQKVVEGAIQRGEQLIVYDIGTSKGITCYF